jgi:hypothetical protein
VFPKAGEGWFVVAHVPARRKRKIVVPDGPVTVEQFVEAGDE